MLSFRTVGEALSEDVETGSQWIIFGKAIDGQLADEQLIQVVSVEHFWFAWVALNPDPLL